MPYSNTGPFDLVSGHNTTDNAITVEEWGDYSLTYTYSMDTAYQSCFNYMPNGVDAAESGNLLRIRFQPQADGTVLIFPAMRQSGVLADVAGAPFSAAYVLGADADVIVTHVGVNFTVSFNGVLIASFTEDGSIDVEPLTLNTGSIAWSACTGELKDIVSAGVVSMSVSSVTGTNIQAGDTVVYNLSDATSATGKTLSTSAGSITPTAQDINSITFLAPDPLTFGDKSINFDTNLLVTVTDGGNSAGANIQIEPPTGDDFDLITSLNGWADVVGVTTGMYALGRFTVGTGTAYLAEGIWQNDAAATYTAQIYDGVWGTLGTITLPEPPVVVDTAVPVITLLGGTVSQSTGEAFNDPGYSALDGTDGDLTNSIVVAGDAVDINTAGTYVITYNVTDAAGNAAVERTRTVTITEADLVVPVITLAGGSETLPLGTAYSDPGFSATDNTDGNISADVQVGGDVVDVNTLGAYTITYNVSDAAGNAAVQRTRTVTIIALASDAGVTTVEAISSRNESGTYAFPLANGYKAQIYSTVNIGFREHVTLFRSSDGGVTYTIPVNSGESYGNTILSIDRNVHSIEGPGFFRIVKSQTAVACAIHVDT